MAKITPAISAQNLASQLNQKFSQFKFQPAARSRWSPTDQTIFYADDPAQLLHELGHAILRHNDFCQDIELIHIERDAWEVASRLASKFGFKISEDQIENALDKYRDWLHKRSLCPKCLQTGLQSRQTLNYRCQNCGARWHANDARICGLRRRLIKT
jgi:ribosomal protein L37AE/L43A